VSEQNKSLLALGIPFSALVSVIFGLMILSFPIGAYVVFNSSIEDKINYDYPLTGNDVFPVDVNFEIPFEFGVFLLFCLQLPCWVQKKIFSNHFLLL